MDKRDVADVLPAARLILRRLGSASTRDGQQLTQTVGALDHTYDSLFRRVGHLRLARNRGWPASEANLRSEIASTARRLQEEARVLVNLCERPVPAEPVLADVLRELLALRGEFDEVEVAVDGGPKYRPAEIVVKLEPIVLEEINLGPFEVRLQLGRLSNSGGISCFDVVALEPNPASSDDSVTHPHVKDGELCAGDASAAITEALRGGRICDAFVLIRSVLQNYNAGSPYVSLDDWDGVSCPECGHSMGRDHSYYCEDCDRDLCDDCMGTCEVCDSSCCLSCLERDPVSRKYCCNSCRAHCDKCDRLVATDDLDEDSQLCPECLAQQEEGEEVTEGSENNTNPEEEPNGQPEQPEGPAGVPGPCVEAFIETAAATAVAL